VAPFFFGMSVDDKALLAWTVKALAMH